MATQQTGNTDREQYVVSFLEWAIENLFDEQGADRAPYRLAFGLPPGSRIGRHHASDTGGVCYRRAQSSDGHNEIFLNPTEASTVQVLAVTLHEYCHAVDDCQSGHKGAFAKLMTAIGFKAPLTGSFPGDELHELLTWYVDENGEIPAGAMLDIRRPDRKPQKTRMLKVQCMNNACGFNFRASKAQLDKLNDVATCPACSLDSLAKDV